MFGIGGESGGRWIRALLGPRLDLIGGFVLIALGLKIILEHLTETA